MKKQLTILLLFLSCFQLTEVFAQDSNHTPFFGTIIDANGNALAGATVLAYKNEVFIDGKTTDQNGDFSLLTDTFDYIKASYIGFKEVELSFEDVLFDDLIVMEENSFELDQIVVKAYNYRIKCHYRCHCKYCKSIEVKKTESFKSIIEKKPWNYFPNPTQGRVEINLDQELKGFIEIFGSKRELLDSKIINEFPMTISLHNYPAGIYFLRYNSNGWVEDIGKIVKVD